MLINDYLVKQSIENDSKVSQLQPKRNIALHRITIPSYTPVEINTTLTGEKGGGGTVPVSSVLLN